MQLKINFVDLRKKIVLDDIKNIYFSVCSIESGNL